MIVGLTGGIGSGKTVVARILECLGCVIFNSDYEAKAAYNDPAVKAAVTALLGTASYLPGDIIDKKYISGRIFENPELLAALNNIIHPAVSLRFSKFIASNPKKIIVKESALLYEANVLKGLDKVILVAADDEKRIQRVMKRDGLHREQVMARIKSQNPQSEKIKIADFVIFNNEDELIVPQVLDVMKQLAHA